MQIADERNALRNRDAEMAGAGGEVAVVEIVGEHARLHEGTHESLERGCIVIDAAQQDGLTDKGHAGVGEAGEGGAGVRCQFARVVCVETDSHSFGGIAECRSKAVCDQVGGDDGNAGVPAYDFDVRDGVDNPQQRADAAL